MSATFGLPSRQDVRAYMKDYPWENFKYEDEFFTDEDIDISIRWAEERLITLPPVDGTSVSSIPRYIMLNGVIAQLFRRAFIKTSINYNPGITENGINIPVGEDAEIFNKLYQLMDQEFSRAAYAYKQANNIKNALSGIKSPYNDMKRKPYLQPVDWSNG